VLGPVPRLALPAAVHDGHAPRALLEPRGGPAHGAREGERELRAVGADILQGRCLGGAEDSDGVAKGATVIWRIVPLKGCDERAVIKQRRDVRRELGPDDDELHADELLGRADAVQVMLREG
jgi:hypothetical protein